MLWMILCHTIFHVKFTQNCIHIPHKQQQNIKPTLKTGYINAIIKRPSPSRINTVTADEPRMERVTESNTARRRVLSSHRVPTFEYISF